MMFRLTCVLLLIPYQFADAPTVLSHDEFSCVDACSKRTLFDILWGCVSTTSICAWVAVHPNFPPRESPFKTMLRRLELMFWAILAPEILPCWALNQLLAAMTVRDAYNEEKGYEKEEFGIWKTLKKWFSLYEIKEAPSKAWTLSHGHFLIMGGFQVVEPPEDGDAAGTEANTVADQGDIINVQPRSSAVANDMEEGRTPARNELRPKEPRVTILTLEMLRELFKTREFEIEATEDDITHRSKADSLTKIIFIFQSTWFILNCLGRRAQGLYLTQLEVTTLALASLNGITLALWWDKPLAAQAVVRVHLKRKLTDAERSAGRNQFRTRLIPFTQGFLESHITAIQDICRSGGNVACLVRLPLAVLSVLLSPIITFILYLDLKPVDVEEKWEVIHGIVLRRSNGSIFLDWLFRLPLAILSVLLSPVISFILCLGPPLAGAGKTRGKPRLSFRSRFVPEIQKFLDSHITAIYHILCRSEGNIPASDWLIRLPISILSLLFAPIIAFAFACFSGWMDLVATLDSFSAEATHVPMFYFPRHPYSNRTLFPLLMIALGTTFGGIHWAGWNLPFPTYMEQKLWHIATLVVTILPISFGHLAYIMMRILKLFLKPDPDDDESLLHITLAISTTMYVSARLVLLGLALANLRDMPPGAFIDIDWTKFYPHIL